MWSEDGRDAGAGGAHDKSMTSCRRDAAAIRRKGPDVPALLVERYDARARARTFDVCSNSATPSDHALGRLTDERNVQHEMVLLAQADALSPEQRNESASLAGVPKTAASWDGGYTMAVTARRTENFLHGLKCVLTPSDALDAAFAPFRAHA